MGFSFRVAPGIRVRASSKGVRASVGPRFARVHVGSGRTGFSTGIGPLSYYSSIGGPAIRPGVSSVSGGTLTAAQAKKLDTAQALRAELDHILNVHRQSFSPVECPKAPIAAPVHLAPLRASLHKQNRQGIGLFAYSARKIAKSEAYAAAVSLAALQFAERQRVQSEQDQTLRAWWNQLLRNDPSVTIDFLNQAFEDNEVKATAFALSGAEAHIAVTVPDESFIPERHPATTPSGNLSIKKMTKKERDFLYKNFVCGLVLATVRECLAIAPGLEKVRVVAIRFTRPGAFSSGRAEPMLGAVFNRSTLSTVDWDNAQAMNIVQETTEKLTLNLRGIAQSMSPLDMSKEKDLGLLVEHIDLQELV